jgi:N-methylhydantoinase A
MAGILGVDVGGTFTDFLLLEDGRLRAFKRPSTPAEPAQGVLAGIQEMVAAPEEVVHGSTVATNAVLERKGARTGLVTTLGFRDVLEIGRQVRPLIYDLEPQRPQPLVPRERRYELAERVDAAATVLAAPKREDIDAILDRAVADGVESLAVSLLFSYLLPAHESLVAEAARQRGLWVSASSELAPEYREYERTSTAVTDAFLAPIVGAYLRELGNAIARTGTLRLRIVQSDGGSADAEAAARRVIALVLSGPAAGVAGAYAAAKLAGFEDVITFDMGGTSTDVALCPGRIVERLDVEIGGLPLRMPAIDVHTIGAGGGSLARLDAGGALRVGPESAGADPGPACYGRGSEPTVTDAQLVLGRLQPRHFLGGRMRLDPERARRAVALLGRATARQAESIVQVANAKMERAIRVISVARGYDPRDFTLVAFGGAGPLHACDLAESLRIPRVLVPTMPGVLSAFGMITAPVTRVFQQPVMRVVSAEAVAELGTLLRRLVGELEERGRAELQSEGYPGGSLRTETTLDVRYRGQSYELSLQLESLDPAAIARVFHERHQRQYGHSDPGRPVEIVNLRCRVSAPGVQPVLEPPPPRPGSVERACLARTRQRFGRWREAPVYDRTLLCSGDRLVGPATIVQMDATTVVPPGWSGTVDGLGNIILER